MVVIFYFFIFIFFPFYPNQHLIQLYQSGKNRNDAGNQSIPIIHLVIGKTGRGKGSLQSILFLRPGESQIYSGVYLPGIDLLLYEYTSTINRQPFDRSH